MRRLQTARPISCLLLVGFGLALVTGTARTSADEIPSTDFLRQQKLFERYCHACHTGEKPKGDFRVDLLSSNFDDEENRASWLNVVEQLNAKTMPPEGKPRPADAEVKVLREWIDGQVAAAEHARRASQGRAVMRRLNQIEYQNTVRDLLGIDLDLQGVLPVDTAAGSFDTSAETLHMSSYQLRGYLTAADQVLDAAIASGSRPPLFKRRIELKDDPGTRRHGVYRHLDDGVAIFASDLASNIQLVFWNFQTRHRGKYRYRISAYAYQSDRPVLFHINGGTNNLGEPPYLIDYFEAPPGKPTVIEFVEQMEAGRNIRLLVDTEIRPRDLERQGGVANYRGPGLVVQWVEIEGPLQDSWPPRSHQLLLGELQQAPATDGSDRREVVSQQPLVDGERILRQFARRAFRRPVTDDDVRPLVARFQAKLDEGYSFEQALRVSLKAVLVSPNFLFLRETTRPSGIVDSSADRARPPGLDEFAVASRLSYFLWSSMPDNELFDLAEQGQLSEPQTLREQVERMLRDPKARAFTENFAGQWLGLREIDATLPDRQLYPEYDDLLRSSMIKEVYLFFEEVLKEDLSLANFVSSDFSMLNERLATHYGIPGVEGLAFRKVSLPKESHRGGVLTMAAILKVTANGTTTSPIVRGAWVLDRILGDPPPRPPANVEAIDPDIRGATTIREQLARHRDVASCAACHVLMDPHGFALEGFDVIGGWRDHYRSIGEGAPVTVNGRRMRYKYGPQVDARDVLADGRPFRNIDEYKSLLLSDTDQLARALAEKLLTYATGTPTTTADRAQVEEIVTSVRGQDYGFRSLVHAIVQSEVFLRK